jgi:glutaredoxin
MSVDEACPVDDDDEDDDMDFEDEWLEDDDCDCELETRREIDRLINEELARVNGDAPPLPPPNQRPKYCQTVPYQPQQPQRPQHRPQQQQPHQQAQAMGNAILSPDFNVVEVRHAAQLSQMLACSRDKAPNSIYVLVFHKTSCPACINYKQRHAQAAHVANKDVTFAYVDVQNPEFRPYVQQFGVASVPSFVFVRGCKSHGAMTGFNPEEFSRRLAQMRATR